MLGVLGDAFVVSDDGRPEIREWARAHPAALFAVARIGQHEQAIAVNRLDWRTRSPRSSVRPDRPERHTIRRAPLTPAVEPDGSGAGVQFPG